MDNSTNQEAFIKIYKDGNDTCTVEVQGQLDDIICMVSAAILANDDLLKIFNSAIEVTEMYKKYKENPSAFINKNIPSC